MREIRGMYKPDNFELYELLDKVTYHTTMHYGDTRWQWFDDRALITLEKLREWAGTTLINDWYWGGENQWGGLRPLNCPVGALMSQHRFGRAFDPKFVFKTADEVREYILSNRDKFPYITCLEFGIPWTHFDCRNYDGLLMIQR